MKMISFCNKKGGVGKTTLCKNVAYKFALDGAKVLLLDLDPQATLTLQVDNNKVKNDLTILKVLPSPDLISLKQIIQETKYKNIDIIIGGEQLNKVITVLKEFYDENKKYFIADLIYEYNEDTFNSYDYVLIDYPPTINELSVSFLMLSDLIIIPINNGIGSYKGIVDLQNTLLNVLKLQNKKMPICKIILNNIKEDKNTNLMLNWIKKNNLISILSNTILTNSSCYVQAENELSSIWTNQYYWRQKQAYEELIKEIK